MQVNNMTDSKSISKPCKHHQRVVCGVIVNVYFSENKNETLPAQIKELLSAAYQSQAKVITAK